MEVELSRRTPTAASPASQQKRPLAKRQPASPQKDVPSKKQAKSERKLPRTSTSPRHIEDSSSMEEGETSAEESLVEIASAKSVIAQSSPAAKAAENASAPGPSQKDDGFTTVGRNGKRIAPIVIDAQSNATELLTQIGNLCNNTSLHRGALRMGSSESSQLLPKSTVLFKIEGYDSKGVTQCYKCQQFNHTASNCHIKPKCLKCGEPHQTSECEIDKVETMYCVNCEAYGHMANYSKCPLYPKPRKGATIKPNYTTIVNSLVRPNVSFAQAAAQQENNKNTAPTPQQMAPRIGQVPTTITAQTQAATTHIAKQQKTCNAKNECMGLITQTLTQTIQALSLLVQQINSIDFSSNTPQPSNANKNKSQRKKEISALVEALLDDYDE
ncbi:nucleic-acid-binding protein from transposon X-element [Trichonephila clavipes]|nr:nucleic-acid-binding protein from transposon X-element [Trichonephila clavipes]